jgi:acetyltransferase-like isoleucine patch superfamily enzyme
MKNPNYSDGQIGKNVWVGTNAIILPAAENSGVHL